jgi:hypothetical protein
VSGGEVGRWACGETAYIRDQEIEYEAGQYGFILTTDSKQIDGNKTRAIFGHPGASEHERYSPIGDREGIFQFRDQYYIEAFYSHGISDFEGKRKNDTSIDNVLAVIHRRNGAAKQVCEYQKSNTPANDNRN